MPISIEKYGVRYYEGGKCPACSSEKDKGGRLKAHRRKNNYLKCEKCKYSIQSTRVIEQREQYAKKKRDSAIGLK